MTVAQHNRVFRNPAPCLVSAPEVPPVQTQGHLYAVAITPDYQPAWDVYGFPSCLIVVQDVDGDSRPDQRVVVVIKHVDSDRDGRFSVGDWILLSPSRVDVIGTGCMKVNEETKRQAAQHALNQLGASRPFALA